MISQGRPTLQTIADAAGVSRSGVSLALRNHPSLPPATRERIQGIARELGYQPNPMISALMANLKAARQVTDRGRIAYLTSHPTRDAWRQIKVYRDFFEGAAQQAARLGYRLEEFWLKEPRMTAARMTTVLKTRNVSGIIVAPFPAGRGHLSLDVSHFAVTALGYSMNRPKLHRVANNHLEGIRLALRKLRQRRFTRVGLVLSKVQDQRANGGYSAGYLTYQQLLRPQDRLPICWTEKMDAPGFRKWILTYRPSAVVSPGFEELRSFSGGTGTAWEKVFLVNLTDPAESDWAQAGIDQLGAVTGGVAVDTIVGQIHRNERGIPLRARLTLTEGIWVERVEAENGDHRFEPRQESRTPAVLELSQAAGMD